MLKKVFLATMLFGLPVIGLSAADKPVLKTFLLNGGYPGKTSDNGRWMVPKISGGVASDKGILILDVQENKYVTFNTPAEQDGQAVIADISDDGKTIVGDFQSKPAVWTESTGKWTMLPMPSGTRSMPTETCAVTPDGRSVVAYGFMPLYDDEGQTIAYPCTSMYWKDGKLVELTNLPDLDITGQQTVDKNGNPIKDIRITDMSADGNILLGSVAYSTAAHFFIYFVDTQTFKYLDVPNDKYSAVGECSLSNNGKWVAGGATYVNIDDKGNYVDEYDVPFRYNIETEEMELFTSTDDMGLMCFAVANDGTMLVSPTDPMRNIYLRNGNIWVDFATILKQKYDVDFNAVTGFDTTGYAAGISDDGLTLISQAEFRGDGYSVVLPEHISKIASGVNMLVNYRTDLVSGTTVSKLNQIQVSFERGVKYKEGMQATISCDGKTIATSTGMKATTTNLRAYAVSFPETAMSTGKEYTITIPAGSFYLEGTDMGSPEITVTLKGRDEAPVGVTKIEPVSGSALAELGYKSMIAITFDSQLALGKGKTAYLYQDGSDDAIGALVMVAQGNMLYAYPAASRKLMKGTKYRVEIPEGAVTDITGYCPSEKISLEYQGSYVIAPPAPGESYVFFDDFSDPNTSLNNFLLYEGDHNEPADEPKAFGFDKDNTPWNFSVRDEDNYDYCAASHSIFATPGKADDWMVIPQLNINNEFYHLNFKTQSYRSAKDDKLKVIVWECNDIFGTLDKATVDKMRAEGKVIFEKKLTPGAKENTLADEWTSESVSLKEFAGKKVYIAFVNENENQSIVFVDDINVLYQGNFVGACMSPTNVVAQNEMEVKGYVSISNDYKYDSIEATFTSADGKHTGTYSKSGLNLGKGDTYEFTFDQKLPLTVGETNKFDLVIKLGQEEQIIPVSIKNMAFEPVKRAVIEEVTGTWCSNCPRGIMAIEEIEKNFGDNAIPIAVHISSSAEGDPFEFPAYAQFLGLNAAPSARVNRLETIVAPNSGLSYTSEAGNETFMDLVIKELDEPAEVEISFGGTVNWDRSKGKIRIPVYFKFALNMSDVNYNVLCVLTEDNLKGNQTNGHYTSSDPFFGEWGRNGQYGLPVVSDYNFVDVARGYSGVSLYGQSGIIPSRVWANAPMYNELWMDIPSSLSTIDENNARVVVMILDASTGKVVNAIRSSYVSGIDENFADSVNADKVSVSDNTIYVNGQAEGVEVYTVQGARVANENLEPGVYVGRKVLDNGNVFTFKVVVR